MSFEDEVLARTEAAMKYQRDKEAQRRAAEREAADKVAAEKALLARANEIGRKAANLLFTAHIRPIAIWDDVETGEFYTASSNGRYHLNTVQKPRKVLAKVGRGWPLLTIHHPGGWQGIHQVPSRPTDYYVLATDGRLGTGSSQVSEKYRDCKSGKQMVAEGIIRPSFFDPEARYGTGRAQDILTLVESDVFLEAVAYMRETGDTYVRGEKHDF